MNQFSTQPLMNRKSWMRRLSGPILAALLGCVVVFLGLEIFVRWSGQKGRAQRHVHIDPTVRWRILCIGHSHTMGVGAPESESFPAQLERQLRARGRSVQVINMGFGGWNTAQILNELPVWLQTYSPQIILVWAGDPNFYNPVGLHQQGEAPRWDPRQTFRSLNFLSLLWNGVGIDSAIGRNEYDPPFGLDLDQAERAMAWAGLIEVGPTDPTRFGPNLNRQIELDLSLGLEREPGHSLVASSYIFHQITRSPISTESLSDLINRHLLNPPEPKKPSPLMAKALIEYARRKTGELGRIQEFLYWQRWAFEFSTYPFRDGDLLTWLIDRRVPPGLSRDQVQVQFQRIVDEIHSTTLLQFGPRVADPRFKQPWDYLLPTSDPSNDYRKRQLRLIESNPYSASMGSAQQFREIAAKERSQESAKAVEARLHQLVPQFAKTLRFDQDWISKSVTSGLTRMIQISRAAGAKPFLQLYHPHRAGFREDLRINDLVRQVAEREGVVAINPLPFLQREIRGRSHELVFTKNYGPYDDHLNELGYKAVADSVESSLQEARVFEAD